MKLIVILLALAAQRHLKIAKTEQRFQWGERYFSWLFPHLNFAQFGWLKLVLLFIPLALITFVLEMSLTRGIFALYQLLVSVLIVWFCLSPFTWNEKVVEVDSGAKDAKAKKTTLKKKVVVMPMLEQLLSDANSQVFAVLFWFVVFGPVGAALYRAITVLKQSTERHDSLAVLQVSATTLEQLVNWLPARITSFSYLLAGDFSHGFGRWLELAKQGLSSSKDILNQVGLLVMSVDSQADSQDELQAMTKRLLDRSLIIWLVFIAIFTLGKLMY